MVFLLFVSTEASTEAFTKLLPESAEVMQLEASDKPTLTTTYRLEKIFYLSPQIKLFFLLKQEIS